MLAGRLLRLFGCYVLFVQLLTKCLLGVANLDKLPRCRHRHTLVLTFKVLEKPLDFVGQIAREINHFVDSADALTGVHSSRMNDFGFQKLFFGAKL